MTAPRAPWLGVVALAAALAAGCGGKDAEPDPAERLREAGRALDEGRAGMALGVLGDGDAPGFALLRVRALLALQRWGEAARVVARAQGPDAVAMGCELASARSDIDAERRCREALAASPQDVHLTVALAATLDRMHRPAEAEQLLRDAVQQNGTSVAHDAFVSHLERFGWVREAVVAAEAWLAAEPARPGLSQRVVALLERKVRGDLLDGRATEAQAAARRALELAPERQQMRYFLADALAATGDHEGAATERARAKAAGVEPPPPPSAVPGDPPQPPHPPH